MDFVGVDVSAKRLDVALGGKLLSFPNPEGIPDLIAALPPGAVVGLEATGVYGRPLAFALHRAGFHVYVLNPFAVKSYARSLLLRSKTDRVDARLIARYLADRYPDLPLYEPAPEVIYQAGLLVRFARGLVVQRVAVLNRLHAWQYAWPQGLEVVAHVPRTLEALRGNLEALAVDLLRSDPEAWRQFRALQTLPGIGPSSALTILAYSGDLRRFKSARAYAAFTGLAPVVHQSGALPEVGRISRAGPAPLRATFWLASLHAVKVEPYASLYARLLQAGKPPQVARVAVAHRLARAAWAVVVRSV
ncbi:transposase [Thermus phage phiOH16]|nr:transposase [Thermus phage phiOH16]